MQNPAAVGECGRYVTGVGKGWTFSMSFRTIGNKNESETVFIP